MALALDFDERGAQDLADATADISRHSSPTTTTPTKDNDRAALTYTRPSPVSGFARRHTVNVFPVDLRITV